MRRSKMSKFDYGIFFGGDDTLAVSKEKYSREQAIEIAKAEICDGIRYLYVGNGYVRHRAGVDEDYKPCVCWWLEYTEHKRSCPCFVFHASNSNDQNFRSEYEMIDLQEEKKWERLMQ